MNVLILIGLVVASGLSISRTPPRPSLDNAATREGVNVSGSIITLGEYYVSVTIANQSFFVQIDTGSSLFAVPAAGNHSVLYNPAASSTYQPVSCSASFCQQCGSYLGSSQCYFSETFGGGDSISGVLATDLVELGGITARASVAMIMQESGTFENAPVEGILGLAQPSLACNPSCVPPLLDSLGVASLFGICLCASAGGGELDMGAVVPSRAVNATLFYTPLVPQSGFYQVTLLDILGDSTSLVGSFQQPLFDSVVTIVDSGTTLLLAPTWLYENLISYLQGLNLPGVNVLAQGSCTCLTAAEILEYPTLWLQFADATNNSRTGFQVPIGPQEYLVGVNGLACLGIGSTTTNLLILGDVFMQSIYTVFDVANSRIGFGSLANTTCGSCQAANLFPSACGGALEPLPMTLYVGNTNITNVSSCPPRPSFATCVDFCHALPSSSSSLGPPSENVWLTTFSWQWQIIILTVGTLVVTSFIWLAVLCLTRSHANSSNI
jgi:hypothetical protein